MSRTLGALFLLAGATGPALAQGAGAVANDGGWEVETRFSLAAGLLDASGAGAPDAGDLLADGQLVVSRSDVLDSGLALDWRFEARVQRDAATRPRFAGALGTCAAGALNCPADGLLSPVSPVTGIAAGGTPFDEDVVAALEGASLAVTGPWGEGVFGLDAGAATRLDARAPQILQAVSAFSPSLDPTGLSLVRARNDVTGSSLKATYMSPRLLGLRLGGSWTPEANQRGVDFDPRPSGPGLAVAGLENVREAALSFARRFPASGLRIRAAITGTWAESTSSPTTFGDYAAWGAGLEVENGSWTAGGRWLASDNAAVSGGDYEALEFALVRQGETWRVGVEAGWAQDSLTRTEGRTFLVGLSRKLGQNFTLGAAWMDADADLPVPGASAGHTNVGNGGLIFELSVRN